MKKSLIKSFAALALLAAGAAHAEGIDLKPFKPAYASVELGEAIRFGVKDLVPAATSVDRTDHTGGLTVGWNTPWPGTSVEFAYSRVGTTRYFGAGRTAKHRLDMAGVRVAHRYALADKWSMTANAGLMFTNGTDNETFVKAYPGDTTRPAVTVGATLDYAATKEGTVFLRAQSTLQPAVGNGHALQLMAGVRHHF